VGAQQDDTPQDLSDLNGSGAPGYGAVTYRARRQFASNPGREEGAAMSDPGSKGKPAVKPRR